MIAKFNISNGGQVQLKTIEGVAGMACTKKMKELQAMMPGKVDPDTEKITQDYHKQLKSNQTLTLNE